MDLALVTLFIFTQELDQIKRKHLITSGFQSVGHLKLLEFYCIQVSKNWCASSETVTKCNYDYISLNDESITLFSLNQ